RDGERVDLPGGAEVVRGDYLADEAEYSREPGGEREDRRRPCEAAAGALIHPREYREGTLWYHAAARELRAFSHECRTSDNRRSGFAPPRSSGSRTCTTARLRRRSRSASRLRSRTATRTASSPS